jgi:glycerol-3-phosphate acyltransferase PlsY
MNLWIALLAAVMGYLLGSISFARLVTRLVAPGQEVTGVEYRVPGTDESVEVKAVQATAVANRLGSRYGCLTALLDILKVAIPALVFRIAYPGTSYFLIAAAMGLVGHNWPLYHRFKGGRGISAIYGGFLVIDWLGTLVTSIVAMFLGLGVFRVVFVDLSVLVAYAGGIVLMIPWIWFRTRDLAHLAYVVFANVIFVLAAIPDIRMMRDVRRRGIEIDLATQMDATPMGRGLKRMEDWFRRLRGTPSQEDTQQD